MPQKDALKSLNEYEKVQRSPIPQTLVNYYDLKAFKKTGQHFRVKQSPYPMACDANHFYRSKSTQKYFKELSEKAMPLFYRKNGLKQTIAANYKWIKAFNSTPKDYKDFLPKLENAELSIIMTNTLTEIVEKELAEKKFFNMPPHELLKLTNPPINLTTEEKILAKKEMHLTDKEMGDKYGWLMATDLLKDGPEKVGAKIKQMLTQLDTQRLIENREKNEAFVNNYRASEETLAFAENVRTLNYLSCAAHKFVLMGRFKCRALLTEIGGKYGLTYKDALFCMPEEVKSGKIDKKLIEKRKNPEYKLLMDEQNQFIEIGS